MSLSYFRYRVPRTLNGRKANSCSSDSPFGSVTGTSRTLTAGADAMLRCVAEFKRKGYLVDRLFGLVNLMQAGLMRFIAETRFMEVEIVSPSMTTVNRWPCLRLPFSAYRVIWGTPQIEDYTHLSILTQA